MDDLDDLLASMRSGKQEKKHGPAKAKKVASPVPADDGAGKSKGLAGRAAGPSREDKAPRGGVQSDVQLGKDSRTKRAGVRDARTPAAPQPAPSVVKPLPRATERQQPITAAATEKKLFGQHDKHEDKPASGKLQQTGYKGNMPKPFELLPRLPDHLPKKFKTGDLKVGDSVWYRGHERYWLIDVQPFESTSYVRVSSIATRPGGSLPKDAEIFWVHADLLELAPVKGPTFAAQPTRHAVETREKMKAEGVTDVGDQIATMLRGKTLDEAYGVCSKFIRIPEDELRNKYRKLNPGQQRMNLGNRMRGHAKKFGFK